MGGYGSGQWRSARYATVDASCVLDTAWLKRRNAFHLGAHVGAVSTWTRRPSGVVTESVWWETDLRDAATPVLWLRYSAGGTRVDERVPLGRTRPTYGGARWWFACPCRCQRCAKLYLPPGARRFRCRRCYRLAYQCQRETQPDRLLRRARKLWERIGCAPGELPRKTQKPRWMRNRTYWKLRNEADELDGVSLYLACQRWLPGLDA